MTLTEIRGERQHARLKTRRWHALNAMEKARTEEISAKYGHTGSQNHTYHQAMADQNRIKAEGKGLMSYIHRSRSKKLQHMHTQIAEALKGD